MPPAPYTYPLGTWGRVTCSADDTAVLKVRIDEVEGGGFLILTQEPHGSFDTWVEHERDVEAYLATLEVLWETEQTIAPQLSEADRKVMHALGYDERWLSYGILDAAYLKEQTQAWHQPEADRNTEHYRAAAWVRYLNGLTSISTPQLLRVLELSNSDAVLIGHAHHLLVQRGFLTDAQFDLVAGDLQSEGFKRVVQRHRLLRRLSRETPPSDALLTLCVTEGDSNVHDALLARVDLPRPYLELLANQGANKRIRHLATQRVRKMDQ